MYKPALLIGKNVCMDISIISCTKVENTMVDRRFINPSYISGLIKINFSEKFNIEKFLSLLEESWHTIFFDNIVLENVKFDPFRHTIHFNEYFRGTCYIEFYSYDLEF